MYCVNELTAGQGFVYLLLLMHKAVAGRDTAQREWSKVISGEYCDYETFTAICAEDHILIIGTAAYGQMAVGKCVEFDTGQLGCQADVTDVVAGRCSGLQQCELSVNDEALRRRTPCRRGMAVYLKVDYLCLKAVTDEQLCQSMKSEASTAYIASTQVQSAPCEKVHGLYDQRFTLTALPGQHIAFTLINLSLYFQHESRGSQETLGYVQDIESGTKSFIDQTGEVESVIATSKTNRVNVYLSSTPGRVFLIGFHASGCPDLNWGTDVWIERKGSIMTIGCYSSRETWQLKCHGSHWIGSIGNCSQHGLGSVQPTADGNHNERSSWDQPLHKDVILMIIGCMTFFVAVLVVTGGYICIKWSLRRRQCSYTRCQCHSPCSVRGLAGHSEVLYLAPRYTHQEPCVDITPQPEYQPCLHRSPPHSPCEPHTSPRGTPKRNNRDTGSSSPDSVCSDRKKYIVLEGENPNVPRNNV